MNQCTNCGAAITDDDLIIWKCPECGKKYKIKMSKVRSIKKQKDKFENAGQSILKCRECGADMDNGNERLFFKCKECEAVIKGNLNHFVSRDNEYIEDDEYSLSNNLISCPDCGKKISNRAKSCPRCGCPVGKRNKKNRSKKSRKVFIILIIVLTVIVMAGGIGWYFITDDLRRYEQAQELFLKEEYEQALTEFKILDTYKDSKEMCKKCQYELQVDTQFMKSLSKGLMKRWDISEDEKSEKDRYTDSVNAELNILSPFYNESFNDITLGDYAKQYIDVLNLSMDALNIYSSDYDAFWKKWDDAYSKRVALVKIFINEYGLSVDKEYQQTLDELSIDASNIEIENKIDQQITDMIETQFNLNINQDEFGNMTYRLQMNNTTEYTFDYFYSDISAIDVNGNVIGTGSSSQISSWQPGQAAEVDAYVDILNIENLNAINFTAHYQTGEYSG